MYPDKNDVRVLIHASFGPYQVWSADRWKCPEGGEEVIVGWGNGPLSEHFHPDFESFLNQHIDHHVDRKLTDQGRQAPALL